MFKSCLKCSNEFKSKSKEQKFCCQACSSSYSQLGKPSHNKKRSRGVCKCGKPLSRPDDKFCSLDCFYSFSSSQLSTQIDLWIEGADCPFKDFTAIAKWIKKTRGIKCEKCGWCEINEASGKTPTQVDHIDGDVSNNSYANLKVLCPNCHSLTPTFGTLNLGKSKRPKRFSNLMYSPKACALCQTIFTPTRKGMRHCSEKCKNRSNYLNRKKRG
jgi:hypothetical protein